MLSPKPRSTTPKLETDVNCQNLGKALLDVLEKVSKGFERLHWMILVVSLTGFGMGERRSWVTLGYGILSIDMAGLLVV
jgi:hypothetical protein